MKVFLKPGELYIGKSPAIVATVLGSCISVTMFNERLKMGGICHALLPKKNPSTKGVDNYRYVDSSIFHMLKNFEAMGVKKNEIEVKIFGGADVLYTTNRQTVGQANIVTALSIIRDEGLDLLPCDFGGTKGRKIIFYTAEGRIRLKKIEGIPASI